MNPTSLLNRFIPFILLFLTGFVFFPSLFCDLTNWDVYPYILNNQNIKALTTGNLKRIFGEFCHYGYHPLTLLSWAIDYHFFKINPAEMHAINIVFHAANTLLVYYLIRLLIKDNFFSAVTALLFSIHPLRVESVTWVVERKDMLYGFFYLLSLIFYYRYLAFRKTETQLPEENGISLNRNKTIRPYMFYIISFFCFILSCLSKGMAVSLMLNLLMIDFFIKRRWEKQIIIDKLPFLIGSLVFGFLALEATHASGQAVPYSSYLSHAYGEYSVVHRFLLASWALFFYMYKFFLPFNLSVYYPYFFQKENFPLYFWVFPVILTGIFGAVLYSLKYSRKVAFGFGFFLAAVFFILPFHPVNVSLVYERYTYLAHIGIAFIVAGALKFVISNLSSPISHLTSFIACFIFVLWFIFAGYLTRKRIKVWENSDTLWSDYIEKQPGHFMGYLNRGALRAEQGNYEAALADFTLAIERHPNYYESFLNRGNVYILFKQYDKAIVDYSKVLELNPGKIEIYYNRGSAKWILHDTLGACADWTTAYQKGFEPARVKVHKHCR